MLFLREIRLKFFVQLGQGYTENSFSSPREPHKISKNQHSRVGFYILRAHEEPLSLQERYRCRIVLRFARAINSISSSPRHNLTVIWARNRKTAKGGVLFCGPDRTTSRIKEQVREALEVLGFD